MKIAIYGPGGIGSTFAFHLSRAGHDVTVIARGKRLAQLTEDGAIVDVKGTRTPVTVNGTLDTSVPYDLLLVTVLEWQLPAVLPAVKASAAKQVMFMFNTFDSLQPLREAVGAERFTFGFPAIIATLPEGRLQSHVVTVGQHTLATDAKWAEVFTRAGIPTDVHEDIQSWLRTHAVLIGVLMSLAVDAFTRKAGAQWKDARRAALAVREGFSLTRELGSRVTPAPMGALGWLPVPMVSGLFWAMSRLRLIQSLGAAGASEPDALLTSMTRLSPKTALLESLKSTH